MKRNISFLLSCAKCLTIVSVCPGKLFACADGRKRVAPGRVKRPFCEKQARSYILFWKEFLLVKVSLNLSYRL